MSMSMDHMLERLGMSVEDAEQIKERCEDKGITVKQLIQQFLCDLIDNDRSSGSDERMFVSGWFTRSRF